MNGSFLKNMPWMDNPALGLENLFVTHGVRREHSRNSVFKFAAQANDSLFYLHGGFCYTFTVGDNGAEHISRILTRGSIFGEVTCVLPGSHSLTYTKALTDSVVYSLEYSRLLDLVTGNRDLVHAVIESYAWRVGAYHIAVYVKNTFSNEQKVALLLLSAYDPAAGDEYFLLPFSFTHQQMGEIVGLARETVSRVLSRWKEQGVVKTGKGTISANPMRLRRILEDAG